MKRILAIVATLILASSLPAFAQTTDPAMELLQRVAAQGGGKAEVFIGKLPDNLPKVPLPDATVVGSIHESVESPISLDSYDVYYTAAPDALKTYEAALIAAGWTHQSLPASGGGFVASSGPLSAIYCKKDEPVITAQVSDDPTDLRVSISSAGGFRDLVCGRNPLTSFVEAMTRNPLPQLHAPKGVRMSVSQVAVPNGQSAAYIHNGTSAGALLDEFAAQMTKAGWQAGTKATSPASAFQTFTKIDDKKGPWQCVISISAVNGKPGEYVAFIDSANLDALSKGTIQVFSH